MSATEIDASIAALERDTSYVGGEVTPDSVTDSTRRRHHAAAGTVELLERIMADNRAIRSELEAERRAIGEFVAYLDGKTPTDEPTAWGSGVRTLVGYAPGKASTAVSERSIDAWLKQTHQRLSGRVEKSRQRIEPFQAQAQALASGAEGLREAARQAGSNRQVALGATRRALALGSGETVVRSAVRHGRMAEVFAVLEHGFRRSAAALDDLRGGLFELVERTQQHEQGAVEPLGSARDAVLAVSWDDSTPAAQRRETVRTALSGIDALVERSAGYVGDAQLLARQQLHCWSQANNAIVAELEQLSAQRVAPFAGDGLKAARQLIDAT
ncbi:MAG: hypothetical protein B7733_04515 [Myxococcales bacterium FL481]|nr:MAG: hypothetical protein B7733_04515 [Myxococcales bacterium FL481]